jgi:starvation-inducible DNA-binding protein
MAWVDRKGRPGDVVDMRSWGDYPLNVDTVDEHLRELDRCYEGLLLDHRRVLAHIAQFDPVSEDLLLGHTAALEKDQWFIRSFLYDRQGHPTNTPRHDEHDPFVRSTEPQGQ